MATNDRAGADGNDGQSGSGAPEGGSPDGGSENDDKPITAKQLKAALESQKRHYEGRLDGQRAEFEAFKAGAGTKQEKHVEPPKRYTRAELSAAVTANQITAEQSDEIWAKQVKDEAGDEAERRALAAVNGKTQKERINSDLSAYKRLKPEIMETGSETRQKISEEYRYLTSIGQPETVETELAAIRAVLGPLDKMEKSAAAQRALESEEQSGGGDGRPSNGQGKTFADRLDSRWKKHYEKGIEQGRYKDWKEVESELKFANPKRRQELGLKP